MNNNEDEATVEISVCGETLAVSELWDACSHDGYGGRDVVAYVNSGMSVWPCGRTFQEGGRDGFQEDTGVISCECPTCQRVRSLF